MDVRDAMARIETHEEVCAERYAGIKVRLARMETIFISGTGAVIMLLIGLVLRGTH